MSYSLILSHRFKREAKYLLKKFASLEEELIALRNNLVENPFLGTSIGNHCYKIRLAIESKRKGKSGGARVITYVYVEGKTVYLISIYDKSEQSDISEKELLKLLKDIG